MNLESQFGGVEECCALLSSAPTRLVKHAYARALVSSRSGAYLRGDRSTHTKETGDLVAHLMTDIVVGEKGGKASVGFGKQGLIARLVEYGHSPSFAVLFAIGPETGCDVQSKSK